MATATLDPDRVEKEMAGSPAAGDGATPWSASWRPFATTSSTNLSREAGEGEYGVVLKGELEDYSLEVDEETTRRRREELRAERERASGNGEVES